MMILCLVGSEMTRRILRQFTLQFFIYVDVIKLGDNNHSSIAERLCPNVLLLIATSLEELLDCFGFDTVRLKTFPDSHVEIAFREIEVAIARFIFVHLFSPPLM